MVDIAELEKTTEAIIAARRTLAEAREQAISCKEILADKERKLVLGGLDGKNQAERDASMRTQTVLERTALGDSERLERAAVLELEVCKDIRRCQENIIAIEMEA